MYVQTVLGSPSWSLDQLPAKGKSILQEHSELAQEKRSFKRVSACGPSLVMLLHRHYGKNIMQDEACIPGALHR